MWNRMGRLVVCGLRSCALAGNLPLYRGKNGMSPDDFAHAGYGPSAERTTIPAVRSLGNEGEPSMCDYSLHHVASRPAKIEDRLVTSQFHSITRGFSAVGEPNVAVCLLPGTELAFDRNVE